MPNKQLKPSAELRAVVRNEGISALLYEEESQAWNNGAHDTGNRLPNCHRWIAIHHPMQKVGQYDTREKARDAARLWKRLYAEEHEVSID